ncbi:MAG: c-type cytochrome domain-containing protein [Pirellula sp.]
MNRWLVLALVLSVPCLPVARTLRADELSDLRDSIAKAGQQLKAGQVVDSIKLVDEASAKIKLLVDAAQAKELAELKKLHAQILKTREVLELQGADFSDLPTWDELIKSKKPLPAKPTVPSTSQPTKNEPKPAPSSNQSIIFARDVAPWLVDQCGRCHINAERGGFSMATFNALMKGSKGGVVVFAGDPAASRIVEVIETGDMPRGGGKVSPEHFSKLKQWIKDGARLDGPPDGAASPLMQLVKSAALSGTPKSAATIAPIIGAVPAGKESVSFARDIAPILISRCNGCHFGGGTRIFGGLRFNNFTGLAKGGDSGIAIEPYKPDESLLVRKLLGTSGARMPMGRTPLSDEQIRMVSTWIKEGAAFDGKNKDQSLDQVAGQAWASAASHTELMDKRKSMARDKWKVVAPNREPSQAGDDELFILGDIGDENAKALLAQANTALKDVRKMFKLSHKEPLIKGGIVVFALKQRYDYSEFGTMIESRSLPAEWSSHWRDGALDSYIAMVFDKAEDKINESSLVQQMVSLWVGSYDGVPKWFADGVGRHAFAQLVGPNDARVQPWLRRLPQSISQLKNLKPFLDGSMNDEDSATIGFGVIRFMHESKMKNQFDSLIRSLVSGKNFDQAATASVGKIDLFLQRVLGKSK